MREFILLAIIFSCVLAAATPCNGSHPYALAGQCYIQCPWKAPTQYFSYDPTYTCESTCPSPYFAFNGNYSCIQICPSTPNTTYYDYTNRKCVNVCPVNTFAAGNQSCLTSCPSGQWGDTTNWICVTTCPTNSFYSNVSIPICVLKCPSNYYAYPIDKKCYNGGSCPSSPVKYYSDDTTARCVNKCPTGYYADNSTSRCLIFCSNGFFADQASGTCVSTCPSGYYRSSVTRTCVRACTIGYYSDPNTNNCTTLCSIGFGDASTGTCVSECPSPMFGDPSIKLCVAICSSGLYADNFTQSCVAAASCYSNTVGDPTTNKCINPINCPNSPYMFADLTNKVCTTRCNPTWGDTVSRTCVSSCPWNPATYVTWANADNRQCVTQCPQFPIKYADNHTKTCTSSCPQPPTVTYPTFADPGSQFCVQQCPNGFYADTTLFSCVRQCNTIPTIQFFNPRNGSCVASCPTGYFADPSTLQCVLNCSSKPRYFAYSINNTCLEVCPSGYFGDNSTGRCVNQCPQTTLQFADPSTNLCVNRCPNFPDYYGQLEFNGTRSCVGTCTVGFFADPLTRRCVSKCDMSQGYYGQKISPLRKCVLICNSGWFKNNRTGQCVNQCQNFPIKTYGDPVTTFCVQECPAHLYANPNNNLCVLPPSCPSSFFADNSTNTCVKLCPFAQNTFGDSSSRKCVEFCPNGTYADPISRLCSTSCSSSWLFKDPSSNRCVRTCPSIPNLYALSLTMTCVAQCTNNTFAYDLTRRCVSMCPSTPPFYADLQVNRCIPKCQNETYMFFNNTFRGCLPTCPPRVFSTFYQVALFADNTTWSCVPVCPQNKDLYSFSHPDFATIRRCVSTCPMVNSTFYFAENVTQSCVTKCPYATQLTYGDIFTSKCVLSCSRKQYRDNTTARCVYQCSPGYFADNTTWSCVSECPTGFYAETINRTCALHCPTDYYADNETKYCTSLCNSTEYMYSDNTTWKCVRRCTQFPDFYADNLTKLCSSACTGGMFADPGTRSCMPALNCSNSMIGDPNSGRCISICPIAVPSFWDEATNLCTEVCDDGFYADNSTMECVPECPSDPDFFAFNHSTAKGLCVLFCPVSPVPYYRHEPTRQCLEFCPGPSHFRDTLNMLCVTECPPYYYAQVIDRICVLNCSENSKYAFNGTCFVDCPEGLNADPTTFLCVEVCPFGYFAQNGTCVQNCTGVLYADPFLKQCVSFCSPDYYAYDPARDCRQDCQPYYKYFADQSCIPSCPATANFSTNLYMDPTTFSCLNECLPTWYADNETRSCEQTCSSNLFADNSTGRCVEKCPQQPDYYGYNRVCYFPCPNTSPLLFAQNQTRTCNTTCPNGSYADSFNLRCVQVCTQIQYGFMGPPPVCLDECPPPLYGYNQTKECVEICPNGTFGDNNTRICLERCPTETYADSNLNLCVQVCNASIPQFADNSTQRCVKKCPSIPSLYGQFLAEGPQCVVACLTSGWFTLNTTRLCVDQCPQPFFADPITGDCAYHCPINYDLYADNQTRTCSSTCPNVTINSTDFNTYADDSTKRCVWKCPFNPSTYGDNSTNTCVRKCPPLSYGDNDTRLCLEKCFFNVPFNGVLKFTYAQNVTTFCLKVCPPGSWADNLTYTCVSKCTFGYYADNSTWRCVLMCPANPVSFAYTEANNTGVCIPSCPNGFFASDVGRICMPSRCPTRPYFYYRDYQNNQCVLKCVYPYFGEVSSQSCTRNCSYGFFQDLGEMKCTACPSTCLTCINSANCSTCQPNLYSYLGQCITNCPTFPVYYYKYDPSFSCIENCPAPFFGFEGTGKCELTCPGTYFKNSTTSTCQACPTGCDGCYAQTCTSCITGYVFVQKRKSCSKMCSLALPYYLTGECVSSCPNGTFLLDDLVNCQKCNAICAQCSQRATNCTKCQGNFWYNYNCVTQCPKDFYVDKNNYCRQCSSNPSVCALPPLNYTFYTETVKYQLFIVVKFNRPVNLDKNEFAKIAKFRTAKGVLKASQYRFSSTTPDTYRLRILDASSLNQQSLSLSFDAGFIFDGSGLGLSTMTQSTLVDTSTSITAEIQAQAQAVSGKVDVVSWILIVVLVLMMLRCSYPLIVFIDLLQYIHLHIYIVLLPLPYLYMESLSALKNVNFVFLPKLSSNPTSDANAIYYDFQPDTSFLGNCQSLVFFLAIFGSTYIIFALLSAKCNKIKWLRTRARKIYRSRMKYSFLHQIFYYTEYYVLFFAFYQFTGANSHLQSSAANLAAAVVALIAYVVWLVMITYIGTKYRHRLDKIPKKFEFLVYEESQFPMEIPMRGLFKLVVGFILITGDASVQLILLMVFNLVYLIYTVCYAPSKNKITNMLNIFLMVAFIVCEIVLFIYNTSNKHTDYQNVISYVMLGLMGLMIITVLVWIIYRLIVFVRQDVMGIQNEQVSEKQKESVKHSKDQYQKVKPSLKQSLYHESSQKIHEKDKEMNISQLNFKDQQDRQSDTPQITADQAIQLFTYHHIPKKTEGMLKQERQLMGLKEQKKQQKQIVIEIDEDELIDSAVRIDSRQSSRVKDKKMKATRARGHLRIENEDSLQELEDIRLQQKQKNQVREKSQSESSGGYWNRRQRERAQAKQNQSKPQEQNKVVWDVDNLQQNSQE